MQNKKLNRIFLIILVILFVFGFYGLQKFSQFISEVRAAKREEIDQFTKSPGPKPDYPKTERFESSAETRPESQSKATEAPQVVDAKSDGSRESAKKILEFYNQRPLFWTCNWFKDKLADRITKDQIQNPQLPRSINLLFKMDAMMTPFHYQVRLPVNQEVFLALDEEPSLIHDVEFAIKLYQAKAELEKNLKNLQQFQIQTYYAWIYAQILTKNPSLIGDANAQNLCARITSETELLTQDQLNDEIFNFLDRAQVKKDEIEFNEKFQPNIEIKWGEQGFYYQGLNPELKHLLQSSDK